MKRIKFSVERSIVGDCNDEALVSDHHDSYGSPREQLVEAVIQDIRTDVQVTAGGVTLHLAAWLDPEHWAEEWEEKGIGDVDEFVNGLVRQ